MSNGNKNYSDFTAKEPSLGYLYQIRYAMYLLLSSQSDGNQKILIETLDDIEFHSTDLIKLTQLKYHKNRSQNLTDRSSDFWKTMRVWCEQIKNGKIELDATIFTLITTESISANSLISKIQEKLNIDDIINELNEIANETSNQTNLPGYVAYNSLNSKQKHKLIQSISIIDSSMDFSDLKSNIFHILRLSTLPKNIELLFEQLEGWWFEQTVRHLQGTIPEIYFSDLNKKILNIADSFKIDNLPINFPEIITVSDDELKQQKSMVFLKQLNLIKASNRIEKNALSDYYRAFKQRSEWIRADLLNPQEEINYDKRLKDDWHRKFDLLLDDCDNDPNIDKADKGNNFYKIFYIESPPRIYIRERFTEKYLTLGSYQMLSNEKKVGWHPDYLKLLEEENELE